MSVITAGRFRSAFVLPTARVGASRAVTAALASAGSVAVAIGLFTVSWERFANLALGPYNVKLPSVLLSLAAVLLVPMWRSRMAALRTSRPATAFLVLTGTVLLLLAAATLVGGGIAPGAAQLVAVLTGAVLPALAVLAVVRDQASLRWVLRWFVAGAVVASVFGVYQLFAFYLRLPQGVPYTSTGVDGVTGRIAALSYEPAYFVALLLLAFGAAASLALLNRTVLGWVPVGWFALVLVLANVRALLFLVPVLALLLALRWVQNRVLLLRMGVAGAVAVMLVAGGTAAVGAVAETIRTAAAPPPVSGPVSPAAPSASPSASATPRPTPTALPAIPPAEQGNTPANVLNPNEASSNAPRLELYAAVGEVVLQHPLTGVGPGGLGAAMRENGYVAPNQPGTVVANNIWLQAAADGGLLLLLAELSIAALGVLLLLQRRMRPLQPLIASWVAVVAVSGMLTSYFFDLKVWVVLAVAVAGSVVLTRSGPLSPGRTSATR